MLKHKPPAFQMYVKQWLGDDKVMLMDWDAQGMHFQLMCVSWQQEHPGTLPNEEIIIRRWLKNPSDKVWKRVWPQIKKAWQISKKNPFKLYSRALLREFKKQRAFSRLQTEKAKNSWLSRRKNDDATASATAMPRHHSGNARASNALQSSSSPPGVNFPHTPQGGALASQEVNGRRQNGTNPRTLGTNPRAMESKAIREAAKANQYRDPVILESEKMSVEEMKAIRQANVGLLPKEIAGTLQEIAKSETSETEKASLKAAQ